MDFPVGQRARCRQPVLDLMGCDEPRHEDQLAALGREACGEPQGKGDRNLPARCAPPAPRSVRRPAERAMSNSWSCSSTPRGSAVFSASVTAPEMTVAGGKVSPSLGMRRLAWNIRACPLASSTQVKRNGTEVPFRRCRDPVPVTGGHDRLNSHRLVVVRSMESHGAPSRLSRPKAASDCRVSRPALPAQR